MPTKSYVQDYGKYKAFHLDNGGKLDVKFAWDAPEGIPKPVVFTYHKLVESRIDAFMEEDEKRTAAIRKQLKAWDKEVRSSQDLAALKTFVESVNDSLKYRFSDIWGGGRKVGELLAKQVAADLQKDGHLEPAVKAILDKTRHEIDVKIRTNFAVSIAKEILSGVAAGVSADVVSLVLRTTGGAIGLGKAVYEFRKESKSLNDAAGLLQSLLSQQAKLMQESAKKYELVNHHLALMYAHVEKEKADFVRVEDDLKKLDSAFARMEPATAKALGSAPDDIARIKEMVTRIRTAEMAADEARFKELEHLVEATVPLFDQEALSKVMKEMGGFDAWGAALEKRLGEAAKMMELGGKVAKIVTKVAKA